MSAFVICSQCGTAAECADEHVARSEGWTKLSIDGVVGHANQSEWRGLCSDCSETN